jgi:hypothetical protein
MPFLSRAPGGRLTVMTDEVLEMKVGSEISCLLIDRLRDDGIRVLVGKEAIVNGVVMVEALGEGS